MANGMRPRSMTTKHHAIAAENSTDDRGVGNVGVQAHVSAVNWNLNAPLDPFLRSAST